MRNSKLYFICLVLFSCSTNPEGLSQVSTPATQQVDKNSSIAAATAQAAAITGTMTKSTNPGDAGGTTGGYGIAALTAIRNLTESYCDIFLQHEQDTNAIELPSGSTIAIRVIDPNNPEEGPNFPYYAARKIDGALRLVADGKDPNDPASQFFVNQWRDSELRTWYLLKPKVKEDTYLVAKESQEVIFKSISAGAATSADPSKAESPHWQLSGSNLQTCGLLSRLPSNGYLSCRDKTDKALTSSFGFRPVEFGPDGNLVYNSIELTGFRCGWSPEGIVGNWQGNGQVNWVAGWEKDFTVVPAMENADTVLKNDMIARLILSKGFETLPYFQQTKTVMVGIVQAGHVGEYATGNTNKVLRGKGEEVHLSATEKFARAVQGSLGVGGAAALGALLTVGTMGVGAPAGIALMVGAGTGIPGARIVDTKKPPYSMEHAQFLAVAARFCLNRSTQLTSQDTWAELEGPNFLIGERLDKEILKDTDPNSLGFLPQMFLTKASIEKNTNKRKISYGDIVRLTNVKTCLSLFTGEAGVKSDVVLSSGLCSVTQEKFPYITDLKKNKSIFPDPYQYWIVKGPHAAGDRFNASLGEPVQSGDKIRLENLLTGKNLSMPKLSGPINKETQLNLICAGENGIGSGQDDWTISSYSDENLPAEPEIFVGSAFQLSHRNTGLKIAPNLNPDAQIPNTGMPAVAQNTTNPNTTLFIVDFCKKGNVPVDKVAWTGFPYGAPAMDMGSKETLSIEVIERGMGGGIPTNQTLPLNDITIIKNDLTVTGFAKEEIQEFQSGMEINLTALQSKGVGWVSQSFKEENKAGVMFLVKGNDKANAEIILGNSLSLDYSYKFILGAAGNTCTKLCKRIITSTGKPTDVDIMIVSKDEIASAALRPGLYAPYWVSINNGVIMLGMGQTIGEGILMVYKETDPNITISRIGFGSANDKVGITEVNFTTPLELAKPEVVFKQSKNSISVNQTGPENLQRVFGEQNNKIKFRVPGRASISFSMDKNSDLSLNLFRESINKNLSPATENKYRITIYSGQQTSTQNMQGERWQMAQAFGEQIQNILTAIQADSSKNQTPSSAIETSSQKMQRITSQVAAKLRSTLDNIWPLSSKNRNEQIDAVNIELENRTRAFDEFIQSAGNLEKLSQEDASEFSKTLKSCQSISELSKALGIEISTDLGLGNRGQVKTANEAYANLIEKLFFNPFSRIGKNPFLVIYKIDKNGQPRVAKTVNLDSISKMLGQDSEPVSVATVLATIAAENSQGTPMVENVPQTLTVVKKRSKNQAPNAVVGQQTNRSIQRQSQTEQNSSEKIDIWMDFQDGKFFIGFGKFGQDLFCYYQDKDSTDLQSDSANFDDIQFSSKSGTNISNLTMGSELTITNLDDNTGYGSDEEIFPYRGSLIVIEPYKYSLSQNKNAQVVFRDAISGQTYFPGGVPQQGALYRFMLTLDPTGFPKLDWTLEPENPQKLDLEKRAYIDRSMGDTLFQASTYVQGMGAIGGVIGALTSVAYSGAGVGIQKSAIEKEAELKGYKDVSAQVYTDQAKLSGLATANIPPEAIANKEMFTAALKVAGQNIGDTTKLNLLIPHLMSTVGRVNHPYVVSNSAERELLISYITQIYNTHKLAYANQAIDNTFGDLVKLMMTAYNNRYIIDKNNPQNSKTKKTWYLAANNLAKQILQSRMTDGDSASSSSVAYSGEFSLERMSGQYIWLPSTLPKPGQGCVCFKASGINDFMVSLVAQPKAVVGTTTQMYEISFGAQGNSRTEIRAASLSKPVIFTTEKRALCEEVTTDTTEQYWVNFHDGEVLVGRGTPRIENAIFIDQQEPAKILKKQGITVNYGAIDKLINTPIGSINLNKIPDLFTADGNKLIGLDALDKQSTPFFWKDPFPIKNASYVGISCWDVGATFSDIQILPSIYDYPAQLTNRIKNSIKNVISFAKQAESNGTAGATKILLKVAYEDPNDPAKLISPEAAHLQELDQYIDYNQRTNRELNSLNQQTNASSSNQNGGLPSEVISQTQKAAISTVENPIVINQGSTTVTKTTRSLPYTSTQTVQSTSNTSINQKTGSQNPIVVSVGLSPLTPSAGAVPTSPTQIPSPTPVAKPDTLPAPNYTPPPTPPSNFEPAGIPGFGV